MSYLRGPDRSEVQLLPPCLDDYVTSNAAVRFIDAYVEQLDFQTLGFTHARSKEVGRPPYHPADLTKLFLYGYLNRIRSSRRLEAEACRNLEVMWLLRNVRPDFKTIADFRKDNRNVFKGLFKDFNLLCRKLGLFGAELVAIDGSKFKAVNNSRAYFTQEQLRELIQQIETRIEQYLTQLDEHDQEAEGLPPSAKVEELQEKISSLKERKEKFTDLLTPLELSGQKHIALTDEDAVKLKGPHGYVIGYNVQISVDAKHDLIVVSDVVQDANDRGQLSSMAVAAKEELQADQLQVVADGDYLQAQQLENCEKAGIQTYVPERETTSGQGKEGKPIFPKENFIYDQAANTYLCPGNQILYPTEIHQHRGQERVLYKNRKACAVCSLKTQCTTGDHRVLSRLLHDPVLQRAAERAKSRPDLIARRKEIVEHVFGTLRNWGHDIFLMKGLANVRAEFALSALTYNLRRVLNLVPMAELIKAVAGRRDEMTQAQA